MNRARVVAFILSLSLLGCAEQQAQVAVQASLTALATGLAATDEAVADAWPDAAAEARAHAVREYAGDVESGLERYDVLMRPWTETVDALREARAALYLAQGGVTVWIESGDLPDGWEPLCAGVGLAVSALLELLQPLDLELPAAVPLLAGYATQACAAAGPWIAGR